MAQDPILAAHAVSDNCFEVGGESSPASIRDRMNRAYLVVDRAFKDKVIDAGRDLLVVGAGPSGLTAAVRAAELGVRSVVVERRARHAFLLAACTSRDVEPTLYDWPLDHWAADRFEWAGAPMGLRWQADRADVIALRWRVMLSSILRRYGSLIDLRHGTTPVLTGGAAPKVGATGMLDVPLARVGGPPRTESFGGLVSCVGFGGERTSAGAYSGPLFWETDDLQKYNCGLKKPPRILISGGGDGALQDFTRVMTLRSTKAAFAGVLRALAHTPWLIAGMQGDLRSAEDVAARALSWSTPPHDEPILRRLEQAHESVVSKLQSSSGWPSLEAAVRAMLPSPLPQVHLVHRGSFFGPCYALNRFLTLLTLRVLRATATIRFPDTEVVDVRGAHHRCASAATCHGLAHSVALRSTSSGSVSTKPYDVVVLRHGIAGPRTIFHGAAPSRSRHMLPYFVDL